MFHLKINSDKGVGDPYSWCYEKENFQSVAFILDILALAFPQCNHVHQGIYNIICCNI